MRAGRQARHDEPVGEPVHDECVASPADAGTWHCRHHQTVPVTAAEMVSPRTPHETHASNQPQRTFSSSSSSSSWPPSESSSGAAPTPPRPRRPAPRPLPPPRRGLRPATKKLPAAGLRRPPRRAVDELRLGRHTTVTTCKRQYKRTQTQDSDSQIIKQQQQQQHKHTHTHTPTHTHTRTVCDQPCGVPGHKAGTDRRCHPRRARGRSGHSRTPHT